MKINELSKITGVSKETIHHYIREGILRKPRKTGKNTADYNESYVEQIRIVKELRDNYFLPLPVIKKILKKHKKQTHSEQSSFRFISEYFRPIDRLFANEVIGKEAFCKETGLGMRWLGKMENWGVISAEEREGELVYSQDDVIIGKLVVAIDKIGFGPKEGFDPATLGRYADYFRKEVMAIPVEYLKENRNASSTAEFTNKGSHLIEVMSLFFYHLYRKLVMELYNNHMKTIEKNE